MFYPDSQPDYLSGLHQQHRMYTTDLGKTHHSLSGLYKRLVDIETALSEWKERGLNRTAKKKLQWARSTAKMNVRDLEAQQAELHGYIQQCTDLISSYGVESYQFSPAPWALHAPPTPYPFTPFSPIPPTPWSAGPYRTCFGEDQSEVQVWDLSMLPERGPTSPYAASADSGFGEEPALYLQPFDLDLTASDPNHIFVHELLAGQDQAPAASTPSKRSSLSEKDELPELLPVKVGAEMPEDHGRRFSENAIQLIESRLSPIEPHQGPQRGSSIGPVKPRVQRSISEY